MDVVFVLNGVLFTWDAAKAKANMAKHGLRFETAAEVFFDPFLRVVDATDDDESREAVIGYDDGGQLLFVVHVEPVADRVRMISARRATREERRTYED